MPNERWTDRLRRKMAQQILGGLPLEPRPPELASLAGEPLAELQGLFPLPKFFIFGYPRSGTTLLMRLVSLHPQVHCGREAHFFTHGNDATRIFADGAIRAWLERKSNRWTAGQGLETALVRLVADFLLEREARRLGKTVVGDKTPNSNAGQAVRRLQAVYPDARLVYIVRDGRDAALSHRFQHFIDHPHFLNRADRRIRQNFARDSRPFFARQRSLFTRRAIENEARGWARNVAETHALGQELLGERYTCLRYEDLLAAPAEHLRRLWVFLQVEADFPGMERLVREKLEYNPGAEAQLEKDADLGSALERGKKGNWRELFTERDRQVFKEHAGKALIEWKYEHDQEW
jgi:hypothetical protein